MSSASKPTSQSLTKRPFDDTPHPCLSGFWGADAVLLMARLDQLSNDNGGGFAKRMPSEVYWALVALQRALEYADTTQTVTNPGAPVLNPMLPDTGNPTTLHLTITVSEELAADHADTTAGTLFHTAKAANWLHSGTAQPPAGGAPGAFMQLTNLLGKVRSALNSN